MLAPLRGGVNVAQRQPRLVREVALQQPMGAHDLSRHPFAFRRQLKLLTRGDNQPLLLHAGQQLHQPPIVEPQHAAQ